MLPEMAASYAIGMIPSASLTGLHLYLHRKKLSSPLMRQLQKNLKQIRLFWSDSESSVTPLEENSALKDLYKYRKSVFVLGGLCLALSWLGFLAQLLIMISVRYLAVSRLETRIFNSDLVEKDLPAAEVQRQIDEILSLSV